MDECRTTVLTNEIAQCIGTQVDDVDSRRGAHMNVASGNGGRCAACPNVVQLYVPTRFCNAYEHRSAVLTAYELRVQI